MKTSVGIFETHQSALNAIKKLERSGFPLYKLSLIGHAEIIEDHMRVESNADMDKIGVSIGVIVGPILGLLTGVGFFAIPGLGFLYGAGALVGIIGGFDLGLISGGLISVLTLLGVDEEDSIKYEKHFKEGKLILIVQGEEEEIKWAQEELEMFEPSAKPNKVEEEEWEFA